MPNEAENNIVEAQPPVSFAMLPADLIKIWPRLPDHWRTLLPPLLSFMPNCWPAQETLAEMIGRTRKTVNETLNHMADVGLITITERRIKEGRDKGKRTSSLYGLCDLSDDAKRDLVLANIARRKSNVTPGALHGQGNVPSVTCPVTSKALHTPVTSKGLQEETSTKRQEEKERAGLPPVPSIPLDAGSEQAARVAPCLPELTKARPKAQQPKSAPSTPKERDIEMITASFKSMTQYILYGMPGVIEPAGRHPLSNNNWRRHMSDPHDLTSKDYPIEQWDASDFIGYYWFCVAWYRSQNGLQMTLPNWGRLAGDIRNLRATMTNHQLYVLILTYSQWFNGIRWMLGKAGLAIELNETSLSHGLIRSAANSIINMSEAARAKMAGEFQKSTAEALRAA